MSELDLLGKNCRDIVTGFEGICTGVVEWMYGCRQFVLQPKAENASKKNYSAFFFEKQLEVVDEGVREKVEIPEYQPQKFFGKECRDKVTKVKGICIGRIIWLFNGDQYIIEIQPEDLSKDSRTEWLDEGRIEVTREQEKSVNVSDVQGPRSGGIMEKSCYPDPDHGMRRELNA